MSTDTAIREEQVLTAPLFNYELRLIFKSLSREATSIQNVLDLFYVARGMHELSHIVFLTIDFRSLG